MSVTQFGQFRRKKQWVGGKMTAASADEELRDLRRILSTYVNQFAVGFGLGTEYTTDTLFSITSNSTSNELFRMTTYGAGPGGANNLHFVRSRGTQAVPTAVQSADVFQSVGSRGYDGASWSDSSTAFQVIATENWAAGAHGTKFQFQTTPNGSITRSATVDISSTGIGLLGGAGIIGITDGSDATAGNVGEYKFSAVTNQAVGTSTQFFDITSITLTPGDWDISANFLYITNGASVVSCGAGIGTVTGNDGTGLVSGDSFAAVPPPTATYNSSGSISGYRVNPASGTIYYFKGTTQYTVATPRVYGRISARRVR